MRHGLPPALTHCSMVAAGAAAGDRRIRSYADTAQGPALQLVGPQAFLWHLLHSVMV